MDAITIAAAYALGADVLATFAAASVAVLARGRVGKATVGTLLAGSGGFILGVAFLDIIPQAQQKSPQSNNLVIAIGIAVGILLMIALGKALGAFGMGEKEEEKEKEEQSEKGSSPSERAQRAKVISIGIAIHNVPEALPIGAAVVISPSLSLLVAALMTAETFAESGSIAGELVQTDASKGRIFALTMWPSIMSMAGAPISVVLAGISPVVLALTLGLAAGIMLFVAGEVWTDGRKDAGVAWSSIGLLAGVLIALLASSAAPGAS